MLRRQCDLNLFFCTSFIASISSDDLLTSIRVTSKEMGVQTVLIAASRLVSPSILQKNNLPLLLTVTSKDK